MYNKLHFYNTPLNIDITNHRQKEIAIIIIHGGIKMFLSFVSVFYLYGSLCSPCFLIGSYFDIKNLWLIIPVLLAVIGKHLTEEVCGSACIQASANSYYPPTAKSRANIHNSHYRRNQYSARQRKRFHKRANSACKLRQSSPFRGVCPNSQRCKRPRSNGK